MKIGLLVPGGVDRTGEFDVIPCLLWLIERVARNHELHVFAMWQEPHPTRYELLGAQVHVIGSGPHRLRMVVQVIREHRQKPFDLLHAFWAVPCGVVGSALGRILKVPLLLHLTGGDLAALPEIDYGGLKNRRGAWWLRRAVNGAAYATTPSSQMRFAASRLGIVAERLPLGVALDRWPTLPPRRRNVSEPAQLIHVASLNPVKDPMTLVQAARRLKDQGCQFHLDVVGGDMLGGRIQTLCQEYDLSERVSFRGFLPHRTLRPLMEQAHLLIISSRHEADPIVLLEAAVAGVPAVSTPVGHAVDWTPEAVRTVPIGDPDAMAQEILDLLMSDEERIRMALVAQGLATKEDADWSSQRVQEIYQRLSEGNPV